MDMLIGGRSEFCILKMIIQVGAHLISNLSAVQGAGAGGILALTEIILSDLVPLHERGLYQGMIGSVWSVACTLGPPVVGTLCHYLLISPDSAVQGGAFASRKDWTWRGLFCKTLLSYSLHSFS